MIILCLSTKFSATSDMDLRSSMSRWWGKQPLDSLKCLLHVWSVYILSWHTGRGTPVTLSTSASWESLSAMRDACKWALSAYHYVACSWEPGLISFLSSWFDSEDCQRILGVSLRLTSSHPALRILILNSATQLQWKHLFLLILPFTVQSVVLFFFFLIWY